MLMLICLTTIGILTEKNEETELSDVLIYSTVPGPSTFESFEPTTVSNLVEK